MKNGLSRLKSPWVLLLFSVLLAAFVAWIAYTYLQAREQRIKEEMAARTAGNRTPRVSVVVPREDARIGVVIDGGLFVARDIDEDLVYPDTVTANQFNAVKGQRLARPVLHGRPLRLTDLVAPVVTDVASVLPAGMRAVTIEIDQLNSIAQTMRPGHRVDVFLIGKMQAPKGAEIPEPALNAAMLFMQNLQVLATGKEFEDPSSEAGVQRTRKMVRPGEVEGAQDKEFDTVTVLVTPAQAARLLVGQKLGTFRVALRGEKDAAPVDLRVLTGAQALPELAGRDSRSGIESIVGGQPGRGIIAPTLTANALPNGIGGVRAMVGGSGSGQVQSPAGDADNTKRAVDEVMRRMSQPQHIENRGRATGEAAAAP